ncbi:hypothetical protein RU86_GL000979 [Lactococcus piscium]|uniref:Uncharacterized protein n=2 Tax=Pseudolactococcus piscium TaxID=1364 RepID=A0A2A5S548_9LACT|nr:hypothetical protein RU86_GL000979 [Lactococcus piscium]
MKKKSNWLILLGLVIIGILIGGKIFMNKTVEKNSDEKLYQDAFTQIQKDVTDYLVKNYQGIEKIAWQGIGIEYRNSDIYGSSLLGNYVDSDVRIYVSKDNYFTMNFTLNGQMSFDDEKGKYAYREWDENLNDYVFKDTIRTHTVDSYIKEGIDNTLYKYNDDPDNNVLSVSQSEKEELQTVKKAPVGSKEVEIIYSLKIKELTY